MIVAIWFCIGISLLVVGSVMMSAASRFYRCRDCGSLHSGIGYHIKYRGYVAKFNSPHLHDDPYPVKRCPDCKQKSL